MNRGAARAWPLGVVIWQAPLPPNSGARHTPIVLLFVLQSFPSGQSASAKHPLTHWFVAGLHTWSSPPQSSFPAQGMARTPETQTSKVGSQSSFGAQSVSVEQVGTHVFSSG